MPMQKILLSLLVLSTLLISTHAVSSQEMNGICFLTNALPGVQDLPMPWSCSPALPCNLTGIGCYYDMITIVNLGSLGLAGSIPEEISFFTNLQYLGLTSNNLTGTIPSTLGQLTNLTILNLYNNQLVGTIPTQIANSDIPYKELILGKNELVGTIPTELGQITTIELLDLDFNKLTGTIPSELQYLTSLQYLNLELNFLNGTLPPQLGNLNQLTSLLLQSNRNITGPIPASYGNITQLEILMLGYTSLCGCFPPEWLDLKNLQTCDISNIPHDCSCTVDVKICKPTCGTGQGCPHAPFPPPQPISPPQPLPLPQTVPFPSPESEFLAPVPESESQSEASQPSISAPVPSTTPSGGTIEPVSTPTSTNTGASCEDSEDYSEYFACQNGVWTTSSDLLVNTDITLTNSSFNVGGNVQINAELQIFNSTFQCKQMTIDGSFEEQGSHISVSGSLSTNSHSQVTITLDNNFSPISSNTAQFSGDLYVSPASYLDSYPLLFKYKSYSSEFDSITFPDIQSCQTSEPTYTSTSLKVQISDTCTTNPITSGGSPSGSNNTAIIVGVIVGLIGLIVIIVVVLLIARPDFFPCLPKPGVTTQVPVQVQQGEKDPDYHAMGQV